MILPTEWGQAPVSLKSCVVMLGDEFRSLCLSRGNFSTVSAFPPLPSGTRPPEMPIRLLPRKLSDAEDFQCRQTALSCALLRPPS
jgi:hypothetical protein